MLVDETVQTNDNLERKYYERQMVQDGMSLWKKQLENARIKKSLEQKQVREMMERNWPWGHHQQNKARGLRNLRLEGLFPHQDYEKAKRCVLPLDMGRPGGGAPNVNEIGRQLCRTKEDPILRFQWGKDLRQCVDNTLRYRKNKLEQEAYKKELDKLVEEKKALKNKEKMENLTQERESGWSDSKTLEQLKQEAEIHQVKQNKELNNFRKITIRPPNQITKNEKVLYPKPYDDDFPKSNQSILRKTKLSPLPSIGKENGVELVPIIAQKRCTPIKPLGNHDANRLGYDTSLSKLTLDGNMYLQELHKQMTFKRQHLKEIRLNEIEGARQHFTTLDAFWGRPGHGAPRTCFKKGSIDKLLYPRMIPVGVS